MESNEDTNSPLKNQQGNDWEIIDKASDINLVNPQEIAKTKQNKYPNLLNFANDIAYEEKKKVKNNPEKKSGFTKFTNFFNVFNKINVSPGKKKKLQELEEEAKRNNIDLDKLVVANDGSNPLMKQFTQQFEQDSKNEILMKKFEEFNQKFPLKKINRRNTYHHIYKIIEPLALKPRRYSKSKTIEKIILAENFPKNENKIEIIPENPLKKKHKRKLSEKKLDNQDNIWFLRDLIEKKNNEGLNDILAKMEKCLKENIKKGNSPSPNLKKKNDMHQNKTITGFWDELWEEKAKKIQENSPYGHFPSYQLRSVIVKGGDDLRQELLAMQIILKFQKIFCEAGINLYLKPYEIIVTSANSGILGKYKYISK